jgi:hypothetical protein
MAKITISLYDVAEHSRAYEGMAAFEACLEKAGGDPAFIARRFTWAPCQSSAPHGEQEAQSRRVGFGVGMSSLRRPTSADFSVGR